MFRRQFFGLSLASFFSPLIKLDKKNLVFPKSKPWELTVCPSCFSDKIIKTEDIWICKGCGENIRDFEALVLSFCLYCGGTELKYSVIKKEKTKEGNKIVIKAECLECDGLRRLYYLVDRG